MYMEQGCGVLIGLLLILSIFVVCTGWILSVVWNWIMPEIWEGAPEMSVWMGCLVSFVINLLIRWFKN